MYKQNFFEIESPGESPGFLCRMTLIDRILKVAYYVLYMTDNPKSSKRETGLGRIVEATTAKGKLDMIGVQKLIENLKGSSLEDKIKLLQGSIASVDALIAKPGMYGDALTQINEVRKALVDELDRATGTGKVPPAVETPGAQQI